MTIPVTRIPAGNPEDTPSPPGAILCSNCAACCCRLEVMLITDTGVPDRFIHEYEDGTQVMHRLDDGWCAALDRNTLMCSIYEKRPWICREFEMGSYECREERAEHDGL